MSRWKAGLHHAYRMWSARLHNTRYNHQMSRRDLQSFLVFYTCPRPVAQVTVHRDGRGNIFPMDLIGPVRPPYFLLALHTTARSVDRIKRVGHVTLSYMPIEASERIYALGKNHRAVGIDWESIPFALRTSSLHGSPVPRCAVEILELGIEDAYDLGSHTLFVTRILERERLRDTNLVCHIQGFFDDYLRRKGLRLSLLPW